VGTLLGVTSAAARAQGDSAQCDIKTSHFAVTRAVLYIQNASNEPDSVKRQQALDGAHRSLTEAIQSGGEVDPNMWYFLGIYYAMKGDGFGADSAFDKVENALPGCKNDIAQYRQNVWATVANKGIEGLREGDNDKAKTHFRLANELYADDPTASFYLGTVFATEDDADSALYYYKQSARRSQGDTANAEIHEKSVQNVARIYQVLEQHDSAAVWYREYRKIRPDDPEGLTGHASSLLAAGDTAAAVTLYDSLLAKADVMDPLDLFRTGVALFRTNRADRAALAFEAGLKRNPYYRNGLFNLTNAYFQLAQIAQEGNQAAAMREYARKMVDAGRRLLAVDPRNGQVIRLVAAGYQLLSRDDSTDLWLKRANELTWEVDVQVAREASGGYEVQGLIKPIVPTRIHALRDSITRDSTRLEQVRQMIQTGTDPQTGRAIPASQRSQLNQRQTTLQRRLTGLRQELQRLQASVSIPAITFEFLNAAAAVVATETVAAQSVEPNAPKEFQLTATGEGIVAWRYKVP
jgi:tetratricopeptide (TPR) repeat protein